MGWAAAAVVVAVAAAAVSTTAVVQQGRAQKKVNEYKAQVAQSNQKTAEYQAVSAEQRGDIEAKEYRKKVLRFAAGQRAAYAGGGVQVDSGTPVDMLNYTYQQGEKDALTIKHNAAMEAWGYRTQGQNYASQAAINRAAGANAQTAGYYGAGTTLLNSAGSTAMWATLRYTPSTSAKTPYIPAK